MDLPVFRCTSDELCQPENQTAREWLQAQSLPSFTAALTPIELQQWHQWLRQSEASYLLLRRADLPNRFLALTGLADGHPDYRQFQLLDFSVAHTIDTQHLLPFSELLGAPSIPVFLADPTWKIFYVSPGLVELLGTSAEHWLNRPASLLFHSPAEFYDLCQSGVRFEQLEYVRLRSRTHHNCLQRFLLDSPMRGSEVHYHRGQFTELLKKPGALPNSEVTEHQPLLNDSLRKENASLRARMAERDRYEFAEDLRRQITRAMGNKGSLHEQFAWIIRRLCQHLEWAVGEVWAFHDAPEYIAGWQHPSLLATVEQDWSSYTAPDLLRACHDLKEPKWIVDIWLDGNVSNATALANRGLFSVFLLPLLNGEHTVGILAFFSSAIRAPELAITRVLRLLSGELGQFITKRQAEERLYRVSRLHSQLVQAIRDYALFSIDSAGLIITWEGHAPHLFARARDEALGKPVTVLLEHADDCQRLQSAITHARRSQRGQVLECHNLSRHQYLEFTITAMMEQQETVGYAVVVKDITERHVQQQILKTLNTQLSQLALSIQQQQDEEKKQLAAELHDSVGQTLGLLNLNLGLLQQYLGNDVTPNARFRLEQCKDLAKQAVKTLRAVTGVLRPPLLDDTGLGNALHNLVQNLSIRTHLKVNCQIDEFTARFPGHIENALYRIAEEALLNVAKHANTTQAELRLRLHGNGLLLQIIDDGTGHQQSSPPYASLGILLMRERAQHIGATLDLLIGESGGMEIRVELPSR